MIVRRFSIKNAAKQLKVRKIDLISAIAEGKVVAEYLFCGHFTKVSSVQVKNYLTIKSASSIVRGGFGLLSRLQKEKGEMPSLVYPAELRLTESELIRLQKLIIRASTRRGSFSSRLLMPRDRMIIDVVRQAIKSKMLSGRKYFTDAGKIKSSELANWLLKYKKQEFEDANLKLPKSNSALRHILGQLVNEIKKANN